MRNIVAPSMKDPAGMRKRFVRLAGLPEPVHVVDVQRDAGDESLGEFAGKGASERGLPGFPELLPAVQHRIRIGGRDLQVFLRTLYQLVINGGRHAQLLSRVY